MSGPLTCAPHPLCPLPCAGSQAGAALSAPQFANFLSRLSLSPGPHRSQLEAAGAGWRELGYSDITLTSVISVT